MQLKPDVILSILTVLGTIGSAIAAFLAIRQTIKQRKIAVTPQLVINDYQVRSGEMNNDAYCLFPWPIEHFMANRPELINAGSGVALNVSLNIEFDYLSRMKFFAENQFKINEKYKFEFEDLSSEKDHKIIILLTGLQTNIKKEAETTLNIGYVTPYNINNSIATKIPLSLFYFEIMLNELIFKLKINGDITEPVNGPDLKIKYHDIDGNKYETNYKSKLVVYNKLGRDNKISFRCMLEFQTNHSSWTRRRLQRIRKSYADFMNEHDFNRNR